MEIKPLQWEKLHPGMYCTVDFKPKIQVYTPMDAIGGGIFLTIVDFGIHRRKLAAKSFEEGKLEALRILRRLCLGVIINSGGVEDLTDVFDPLLAEYKKELIKTFEDKRDSSFNFPEFGRGIGACISYIKRS